MAGEVTFLRYLGLNDTDNRTNKKVNNSFGTNRENEKMFNFDAFGWDAVTRVGWYWWFAGLQRVFARVENEV